MVVVVVVEAEAADGDKADKHSSLKNNSLLEKHISHLIFFICAYNQLQKQNNY